MTDQNIQVQIDDINRKLDLILEEVFAQKQSRDSMNDLMDDLSIVGKDVFKNTVIELDKAGVDIYVCGQSAAYNGYSAEELLPEVKIAVSAMTVHVRLQQEGYQAILF